MNKKLNDIREFAINAHGNQLYNNNPYVYHLDKVANLVEPYGETAQIIAYLHDVVEDTDVDLDEIRFIFGSFISTCVDILTNEPGKNRKSSKEATYKKVKFFTDDDEFNIALIVKAADRLANVREGQKNDMYRKEQDKFKEVYFKPGLCDRFWEEIETILK